MYMDKYKFTDEEIPYGILSQFGLTQEMIGDLPKPVLDEIGNGRRSPVLPIEITDEDGNVIRSRTRFALMRKEDGTVDVLFYPKLIESNLDRFDEGQRRILESGKPVIAAMQTPDGRQVQGFHQIDKGTKQILSVPTPVIGRNLQYIADEFHLSNAELTCLRNGEPLTVTDGDELMTIGIDLNEPAGLRVCTGDERQWRGHERKEWGKYTFGCFGCWTMDEDGNLDYIPEEEYSEELWNEMKKNGLRRAQLSQKI